jgi:hypothetical protein
MLQIATIIITESEEVAVSFYEYVDEISLLNAISPTLLPFLSTVIATGLSGSSL